MFSDPLLGQGGPAELPWSLPPAAPPTPHPGLCQSYKSQEKKVRPATALPTLVLAALVSGGWGRSRGGHLGHQPLLVHIKATSWPKGYKKYSRFNSPAAVGGSCLAAFLGGWLWHTYAPVRVPCF